MNRNCYRLLFENYKISESVVDKGLQQWYLSICLEAKGETVVIRPWVGMLGPANHSLDMFQTWKWPKSREDT